VKDALASIEDLCHLMEHCARGAAVREELWATFVSAARVRLAAEIGVHEGDFAAALLARCPQIERYYLVDPWRHLDNWNKPLNAQGDEWEARLTTALSRTSFAKNKRVVLRGTTLEVAERMADGLLDFAYIDGDHTLRGITTDLITIAPKVRPGGWIGGDDFRPGAWQHGPGYEPTLVFPFAVHFAEAMRMPILALPFGQFLIWNVPGHGFRFVDPTGRYRETALRDQFGAGPAVQLLRSALGRRVRSFLRWRGA
jgi:hypothetical protein